MTKAKYSKSLMFVYCILVLSAITYILTLIFVDINEDEALLAEHSYRLVTEGEVRSEFFFGMGSGLEFIQLQYHKLFVIVGSLFSSLFGNSLIVFRAVTVLFSSLFVLLFGKYLIKKENKEFLILTLGLLFIQSTFNTFTIVFRPEVMVMFFGFCSWIFLEKSLGEVGKYALLSGLFAGLALLTHLNGIIFVASGFLLLVLRREFKLSFGFLTTAIIISLFYFWDINNSELFSLWLEQFRNDPTMIEKNMNIFVSSFTNLINEHKRFFHSGEEITLTILLIASIAFAWKYLKNEKQNLLIYLGLLVVFLGMIAHGKTVKYQILYMPYMFMIISYAFFQLKGKLKIIQMSLIGLFALINVYSSVKSLNFEYDPIELNHRAAGLIEANTNVMAKERFFFNDGAEFNLRSPFGFTWKYERYLKQDYNIQQFFEFNLESKNRYIFIDLHSFDSKLIKMIDELELEENDAAYGYQLTHKESDFYLFESID